MQTSYLNNFCHQLEKYRGVTELVLQSKSKMKIKNFVNQHYTIQSKAKMKIKNSVSQHYTVNMVQQISESNIILHQAFGIHRPCS